MALEEKSIFEELAPYARMVVVPGVTIGNLVYSNQQDLYSTSLITSDAGGLIAANTRSQFFQAALGEQAAAQGYAGGVLSLSQTNSRFTRGQAPANQVYVATHLGFSLSRLLTSADLSAPHGESLLRADTGGVATSRSEAFSLSQSFSWDLTIGRGITRTIGLLAEYPTQGTYGVWDDGVPAVPGTPDNASIFSQLGSPDCHMKKLEVPIIFPPLVNVLIEAINGTPVQLIAAATQWVQIRCVLKGYLMTMPVG